MYSLWNTIIIVKYLILLLLISPISADELKISEADDLIPSEKSSQDTKAGKESQDIILSTEKEAAPEEEAAPRGSVPEEEAISKQKENITPQKTPRYVKIMIFMILSLFLISLITNYLLLRWRSKYKDQLITFPENLLDQFHNLGKDFSNIKSGVQSEFNSYTEILKKQAALNNNTSERVSEKYEQIMDSFTSLQKSLDKKDLEIDRLKKGYDLNVIVKYTKKLIKVVGVCESIIDDQKVSKETKDEISFILDYLDELLEDIGVSKYSIDSDISTKSDEFGLPPANEWVVIETSDDSKQFKVKDTLKVGYFIDAEKKQVIKYPKLEVYIKGESNE